MAVPVSKSPSSAASTVEAGPLRARLRSALGSFQGRVRPLSCHSATASPARAAVADALEAYWDLLLAPHWPRMRAVLDADVAYRGRQLANGGAAALFADLDGRLRWDGRTLHIDGHHDDLDIDVAGRGLPLTPSLFARGTIGLVDQALPPYLTYPARGRAELWDGPPSAAAPILAALLGGSRARLLADLDEPSSTTELARRHGLSPGSVSQHLQVLHRAGLLRRSRAGRTVFYRRSLLGDRLSAGG